MPDKIKEILSELKKGLVELYGGSMDIQSQVGIGTQVCLMIPIA